MLVCLTRAYQLLREVSGMVTTQEIQDHFSIPSAASIPLRGCRQEIESAERELGAFLKAVQSLYGDDAAAVPQMIGSALWKALPFPCFEVFRTGDTSQCSPPVVWLSIISGTSRRKAS